MVEKVLRYVSFNHFDTILACDGHPASHPSSQPPRHVAVARTALCYRVVQVKIRSLFKLTRYYGDNFPVVAIHSDTVMGNVVIPW